jgi:hypothetical protein
MGFDDLVNECMIGISTTRRCMYSDLDYEEWRWGQILTGRKDYNPDDQPPTDEDKDAQTQE